MIKKMIGTVLAAFIGGALLRLRPKRVKAGTRTPPPVKQKVTSHQQRYTTGVGGEPSREWRTKESYTRKHRK